MTTTLNLSRRRAGLAALALSVGPLLFGSLLAACGGGGGGGSESPAVASSATPAPAPAAPPRPSSNLDASTFVVGVRIEVQGRTVFQNIGTAFAIDDKLLATNSHVTQAFLQAARDAAAAGGRVTGGSAFQSETGREFPLIEAIVHPSYTGTQSPDVGLLVARDSLPNRLPLASPEEATTLRKGDGLQLNGFPGDVFEQIFGAGFQPGLSVPQASLFSGNVQAVRAFDERVVVDPANISTVQRYEYSMDTSGGTSGSPVLRNGKVVAVHNSGLQVDVLISQGGQVSTKRIPIATASGGIHVKHLHNLIAEYNTGVLEADKRFRLPPPDALVRAGGQGVAGGGAGQAFQGAVANTNNANVAHQVRVSVDQNLLVTGTTQWPANPALGLPARQFTLSGRAQANGKVEFVDNTPEQVPGFRRGVYVGNLNSASGKMSGQYYEINEATNELFYFGDWTTAR